jgi:hypothetical protein
MRRETPTQWRGGLHLQLRMHVLHELCRIDERRLPELWRRARRQAATQKQRIIGETPTLPFLVANTISQETFIADNAHAEERTMHTMREKFFA